MSGTRNVDEHVIRELAAAAQEEELRMALMPICAAFKRWERHEIKSPELGDLMLTYPRKADELYVKYRSHDLAHVHVAQAIATGVLDRARVPLEVLSILADFIRMFERDAAESPERPSREQGLKPASPDPDLL